MERATSYTEHPTARRSPVEPVADLHEERVVGGRVEQLAEVAAERPRAERAVEIAAPLAPHEKERRAGLVLPPQHGVRIEELDVEPAGIVRHRSIAVRPEPGIVGSRPRLVQLPDRRIRALADEG